MLFRPKDLDKGMVGSPVSLVANIKLGLLLYHKTIDMIKWNRAMI